MLQAPLPVITTHVADRRDRGYLAWIAVANEIAHLHLDDPPIDASPHALEIHVEGFDEPLVVLAEPAGEPTSEGFPLRLKPLDTKQAEVLRYELFGGPPPDEESLPPQPAPAERTISFVTPRPTSEPPPMSTRHREALKRRTGGAGPPSASVNRRAPGSLVGRALGDGRFSLDSLIGAGASGEVYRGTHATLRRPIAVKVLHPSLQHDPDYCARFYGEALAASQLDHRNVLRILDYGQEPDGLLYIVMELLDGTNLEDILREEGAMPTQRIVGIISQACAGLAAAHDAGVVHRDIKPENIVVVERRDDEGQRADLVKVCDFGIAHWQPCEASAEISDDDRTLINRPDSSKVVGTPAYMAPEQIRNETVDARTDVYALGVVLYELATGRVPFDGELPMDVLTQHLTEPPPRPSAVRPGVDPALERIILRALDKDPDERQDDARVLRAELRSLAGDEPSMGVSAAHRKVSAKPPLVASDFLDNPADTLAKLGAIEDPYLRCLGVDSLGQALRAAVGAAKIAVAKDMFGWLQTRGDDPGLADQERDQIDRALGALRDPQAAAALAAAVLEGQVARVEDAGPLLAAGGPAAACALVAARKARGSTLEVRARFVAALRRIGASAMPAIVAGLEPLTNLVTRSDEALAEDLLRAMPDTPSDAAGEVTVKLTRLDKPAVGALAVAVTANLWGRRAHPLLVGVLDGPVDTMRLAALESLKKLGGLEDPSLERLARIILGQVPAGDEMKVAAARAFSAAGPGSLARAVTFLRQRLEPPHGLMGSVRMMLGQGEPPAVALALARSLVALDPGGARRVLERYAAARTELRGELEKILRAAGR